MEGEQAIGAEPPPFGLLALAQIGEAKPPKLLGPGPIAPAQEPPPIKESRLRSVGEGLFESRWLILAAMLAGGTLALIYTARLCVPLYRIDASIEIKNSASGARVQTLAHILESQTLLGETLARMPEETRNELAEGQAIPFVPTRSLNDLLRERLHATATPSANVIDISMITPSRRAGTVFVDSLIHELRERTEPQRMSTAQPGLPDEWWASTPKATETISVIDPAIASADPVAPNPFENVSYGLGLGLAGGLMIAFIRKSSMNTFRGPGSIRRTLGVRELGAIPERKLLTAGKGGELHVASQMDVNDESLRYLRSSLLYHPGGQRSQSLVFTSAAQGEGKTSVVINLAMSLAASGRRVLVIDGDLRRPRLHKVLQTPQAPGLADLLRRDPAMLSTILAKHIHPTSFQNLYIVPPGSGGTDTPELLAGTMLPGLIEEFARAYDYVLIDTPPILSCSDARNYARGADGVVLVVRSSETQKRTVVVARDMLLQDGANIIGTVLTGLQGASDYTYSHSTSLTRT